MATQSKDTREVTEHLATGGARNDDHKTRVSATVQDKKGGKKKRKCKEKRWELEEFDDVSKFIKNKQFEFKA